MEILLLHIMVGVALVANLAVQIRVIMLRRRFDARLREIEGHLEALQELADDRHVAALADLAALNERISRLERGYRHPKVGESRPLIRLIRP